jgi:peptide/nickel transport system substrate-binding protein
MRIGLSSPGRSLVSLHALGAALCVLGAVSIAGTPAAAQVARDKAVVIGTSGQINTLDPLRSDYGQTNIIDNMLYDTLVLFDADNNLVGRLAESFKVADDGKSIAVKLRAGVKFHDGAALTAKDVAFTLDRLKKLGLGAALFVEGYDSTTVNGDLDLTINLSAPSTLFLPALCKIYILNSALVTANAGDNDAQTWLQSHDAGSGPYTVKTFDGQAVELGRFDGYWDADPARPEAIVHKRIDESATKRDELRAGTLDVGLLLTNRDVQALKQDPELDVASSVKSTVQADIIFNTQVGPTADPRVRKALRLAYDYDGGLAAVRLGMGTLANGPLPQGITCRPDLPPVKRNVEEAKKLLAEAGQSNLKLQLSFQPVFEAQKQEATLFQSNLRDIGVEVELVPIAFPNYLASLSDPKTIPQMMLLEDFAQYPDPGVMLSKGYRSDAKGTNRAGYANPEVDKLLDQARGTVDDAARCDIYKKVQEIIDNDSVVLDMYTLHRSAVYRKNHVTGVRISPQVSPIEPANIRLVTK